MKKVVVFASLFLAISGGIFAQTSNAVNGKKLFQSRCASCHNFKQRLVGPSLKDVHLKQSESWLIKFIKNSQAVIKSGDKAAVAIFNEYHKVMMPPHPDLKDADIKDIIAYIKEASAKASAPKRK